MIAQNTSGPT
jgi:hypothetical protein